MCVNCIQNNNSFELLIINNRFPQLRLELSYKFRKSMFRFVKTLQQRHTHDTHAHDKHTTRMTLLNMKLLKLRNEHVNSN